MCTLYIYDLIDKLSYYIYGVADMVIVLCIQMSSIYCIKTISNQIAQSFSIIFVEISTFNTSLSLLQLSLKRSQECGVDAAGVNVIPSTTTTVIMYENSTESTLCNKGITLEKSTLVFQLNHSIKCQRLKSCICLYVAVLVRYSHEYCAHKA